jgi:glycosyltransferase involved in cell wall biosynthesis
MLFACKKLSKKTLPKTMKILAAIPCYNEELAIGSVVLKARTYVDEVLVVDDGSTDGTVKVAKTAGAEVVLHEENRGKGRAVRTALSYAVGGGFDMIVLLDGDGQHNPDEIPHVLEPLTNDTADLVIGFRTFHQMPFYRRIGRSVLDHTTGVGGAITDSQCGFRALNGKTIDVFARTLEKDDFAIESEMLRIAQEQQLRLAEVPINSKYGHFDTSTKNPVSHGFSVLNSVIWLIAEKRPLLYISLPSFVLVLIGFFFGLQLLRQYNQSGYFSMPFTMLAGFFIVIGVLGVFMGLVLNVIAKLTMGAHDANE